MKCRRSNLGKIELNSLLNFISPRKTKIITNPQTFLASLIWNIPSFLNTSKRFNCSNFRNFYLLRSPFTFLGLSLNTSQIIRENLQENYWYWKLDCKRLKKSIYLKYFAIYLSFCRLWIISGIKFYRNYFLCHVCISLIKMAGKSAHRL